MMIIYILIHALTLGFGILFFGFYPTIEQVLLTLIFANTECLLVRSIIKDQYE